MQQNNKSIARVNMREENENRYSSCYRKKKWAADFCGNKAL